MIAPAGFVVLAIVYFENCPREINRGPHQKHIPVGAAGLTGMACLHFVIQPGKQLRPLREIVGAVVAETDQHPPGDRQQCGAFFCEPEETADLIMSLCHQTGGIAQGSPGQAFSGVRGDRLHA